MADKVVADSAQDSYHVAQSCPNISLLWVGTPEVDVNREFLTARWETITPIGGMQKIHHVRVFTKDEVGVKKPQQWLGGFRTSGQPPRELHLQMRWSQHYSFFLLSRV